MTSIDWALDEFDSNSFADVYLDMNTAIPKAEATNLFWPKSVSGGVILYDDYAYTGTHFQKQAIGEVALSFGVRVLSIPTGQGFLVRTQ